MKKEIFEQVIITIAIMIVGVSFILVIVDIINQISNPLK